MTHEERELETIQRLKAEREFRAREKECIDRLRQQRADRVDRGMPTAEAGELRVSRMFVLDLDRVEIEESLTLENALTSLVGTR